LSNSKIISLLVSAGLMLTGCGAVDPTPELSVTQESEAEETEKPGLDQELLDKLKAEEDKAWGRDQEDVLDLSKYVESEPISFETYAGYTEGERCSGGFGFQVLGKDKEGNPAFLKCRNGSGSFMVDSSMFDIDAATMMPLVPVEVPSKQRFAYSPHVYIYPQVTAEKPLSQLSSVQNFSNVSPCGVSANKSDGSPDKAFAFPLPSDRPRLKEDFKILVLPVDFPDFEAQSSPSDELADVVDALPKFYQRMSAVPVGFTWTIPETFLRLETPLEDYEMTQNRDFEVLITRTGRYIQDVIDAYDDKYDYSQFDVVIVEEPRQVPDELHELYIPMVYGNGNIRISSDDGYVKSILGTGNDEIRDIPNWIHEFGHLLGLPDRNWQTDAAPGFDIMFGWYGSPEMSIWLRWILGIAKDSQINCVTGGEPSTHWLRPVAWDGDYPKGVVIPINSTTVLVAESRRRQGYDALLGKYGEGVYVYRIDAGAKMYQPDSRVIVDSIRPERSTVEMSWSFDSQLQPGESVSSDGWTIEVLENGDFGDVIQVTKN
jgi:M6 family metalloprotease-like protein